MDGAFVHVARPGTSTDASGNLRHASSHDGLLFGHETI